MTTEAIAAWNGVLFDKFLKYRQIVVTGTALHGDRALAQVAPRAGARVLDLGCGFGETTAQIAELVGPTGFVIGVDAAARFLDIARAENEAAGRTNVRFVVADVEAGVPDGPFDLAFARFGTMFFTSPVRAMRNVRAALAPDGRLCMVVWRKKEFNHAFHDAEQVAISILGHPDKGDEVTCGPGPFSMGSADVTSDILVAAGYRDIAFTRCDADILAGRDIDDAIELALTLGPAGEIVRLAGAAGVAKKPELVAALRAVMEPLARPDGVWLPSSSWIVTARA